MKRLKNLPDVLRRSDLHEALPLGRNTIDALLHDQTIPNIIVRRQRLIPRWAVLQFLGIGRQTPDAGAAGAQKQGHSGTQGRRKSNKSKPGPHRR